MNLLQQNYNNKYGNYYCYYYSQHHFFYYGFNATTLSTFQLTSPWLPHPPIPLAIILLRFHSSLSFVFHSSSLDSVLSHLECSVSLYVALSSFVLNALLPELPFS